MQVDYNVSLFSASKSFILLTYFIDLQRLK
jgi:hypothetical protein